MTLFYRYLPPYTSFLPVKDSDEDRPEATKRSSKPKIRGKIVENLVFSQLSYIAIFIIVICITEREKMKEDPINFSVLNIVFEVIRYHRSPSHWFTRLHMIFGYGSKTLDLHLNRYIFRVHNLTCIIIRESIRRI